MLLILYVFLTYPPPRTLATASTPLKCCIKTSLVTLNVGWILALKPPYP